MQDPEQVRVGPQGRIVIPASLRRTLGLAPGTTLSARIDDGRLILEPRDAVLRRVRSRFAAVPSGTRLADELIAERRAEAKREARR